MQHDILQDIKRVAVELGRSPTYLDYLVQGLGKFSERQVRKYFGNFGLALIAAGLQSAKEAPRKIKSSQLFDKCIDDHLKQYHNLVGKPVDGSPKFRPTLIIGDTHFPFININTMAEFLYFLKQHADYFDHVIQVGDLLDMYSQAKFPRTHNTFTPKQELRLGREMATELWSKVREISPKASCFQLLGNHDVRPMKRIIEACPDAEGFVEREFMELFQFEGVKTIGDSRQEIILDGVVYHHGYRSKNGDHRDHNLMHSVVGHTHTGGVTYRQIRGEVLFELNAGFMGDPESKALSYTAQRISKWTQGFGVIDQWGPRFIAV